MSSDSPPSGIAFGAGRGRARARGRMSPTRIPQVQDGTGSPDQRRAGGVGELTDLMQQSSVTQEVHRSSARGRKQAQSFNPSEDISLRYDDHSMFTLPSFDFIKKGSKGTASKMITNFFRLKRSPGWTLILYDVKIHPECDYAFAKKQILRQQKDVIGAYIFNGTNLYTVNDLPDSARILNGEFRETSYTITLNKVGDLPPEDNRYTSFLSIILRRCMFVMGLQLMGRNFFDPVLAINLSAHRLSLWPGYVTSLRQHERDTLLCVETTHKVIRMDDVLRTIRNIEQNCRGNRQAEILAALKDTIVMTSYNRKTYHVDDVNFALSPTSTFTTKKGTSMTFVEYYANHVKDINGQPANLKITDLNQPLLVVRPRKQDMHRNAKEEKKDIILIPEFCQLTGLTDQMRENFTLMKELSKYLHVGPQERVKEINDFMSKMSSKLELTADLNQWGLAFDKKLVTAEAHCLPPETILFRDKGEEKADNKGDWTRAFRSQKMLTTVDLRRWVVIVPQKDFPGVENLARTMTRVATPLNMKIQSPTEVYKINDIRPATYISAINEMINRHQDLQLLFVILPNNKPEPYGVVKRKLAVEAGIPSQCFVARNVTSKGLMSIATKVVVQMNAKLGGEPWSIKIPLKNLMIIGFDVYHGAKGSKSGSVGAMVATTSPTFARYFSTTSVFKDCNELANTMVTDFTKCLNAYRDENGVLPERIVLFRDGVGDGQLRYVIHWELEQLLKVFKQLYVMQGLPEPKFTFIVVTKKINSRFMTDNGGKYDNPPPGSIVDDVITIPHRFDFFLVSCAARQGTVSPCSYNVIYDTQELGPDKVQLLTYKMCHMYFNWSGTVAVPAPCQYAHKLAFITGVSYQNAAKGTLSRLLHFL